MADGTSDVARLAARLASFATLGVLSTTQDLARAVISHTEGADAELVAEETLCLASIATGRAVQVAVKEAPQVAAAVVPLLLDLPFMYHDYLIGGLLMTQEETPAASTVDDAVYERLKRKQEFYHVHLPEGQFPGERMLEDKMALWMGRISPPRQPESPPQRLESLQLVPILLTHLRLVVAFARQGG